MVVNINYTVFISLEVPCEPGPAPARHILIQPVCPRYRVLPMPVSMVSASEGIIAVRWRLVAPIHLNSPLIPVSPRIGCGRKALLDT